MFQYRVISLWKRLLCFFSQDIYGFFNLMALRLFFQNKICINTSRFIELNEHLFLIIMRFILQKPLSTTALEKGRITWTLSNCWMVGKAADRTVSSRRFSTTMGRHIFFFISDNSMSIAFISLFFCICLHWFVIT